MKENIIGTVIIHHVNIESLFCCKILAFVTTAPIAVIRVNWAERAGSWFKDIFFNTKVTVMNSIF